MQIAELLQDILNNPVPSLMVVANLIIIESLLSVDNAAVLATMVMDLPVQERKKALKYGIIGAYIFRGICLLSAAYLVNFWYLKPLGGLYLVYITYSWAKGKLSGNGGGHKVAKDKSESWFYKVTVGTIGNFWATVALVEVMDLAFSIDNVFAAVAFSKNILLIWTGVFIGILAMRFVAQVFVNLMEKYPFLETCAFIVIGILGLKLSFAVFEHFNPESPITKFMESHEADWITSGLTVGIFFVPFITSLLFNFPKRNK